MPLHSADEILDLVDEDDQVIGQAPRSVVYANHWSNFRVINALILNSLGQLWIPRRTANKRIFPSCLDCSVGGHVDHGETYDQAFKRETQEELGLNVDRLMYRILGKMTPHEHGMSAFAMIYEIRLDEVPAYNPDDFTEYYWLTPKELFDRLANGDCSKDDLPRAIKRFYTQPVSP